MNELRGTELGEPIVDEWDDTPVEDISVFEFDDAVTKYKILKDKNKEAADAKTEAGHRVEEQGLVLLDLFKRSGKKNWRVDGVGLVSKKSTFQVTTPKSREDKDSFFDFVKARDEDEYYKLMSVNSRTLNTFYNQLMDEDASMDVPGLQEPTHKESVSLRKA